MRGVFFALRLRVYRRRLGGERLREELGCGLAAGVERGLP